MRFVPFALVAASLTLASFSANATLAAAIKDAAATTSSQVIHVAQGCGRGWHRGPYGHCRPN